MKAKTFGATERKSRPAGDVSVIKGSDPNA
jgi:hypothetical protein